MGRIYLIRHGQVAWNARSAYVGSTDIPLNDTGRAQAERLARRLERDDISAIYASDLSRARETAEIVAERLDLSVVLMPALRELDYGEWEGMPEVKVPKRYPELFEAWRADPAQVSTPGGETVQELADRAYPAFCGIAEQHADENVAVVGHKCTNRVLLCRILGIDINRYRQVGQGNAALNIIERRKDGRLVVEQINECCHLSRLGG